VFETKDVLIINGRNLREIGKDFKGNWEERETAAGKVLREALLNGEPVTIVTSTFDNNGKVTFHNKDIRLDLDKLNAMDREKNHNIFRRALDTIGLWPIPKKYPTNKERDEKINAALANPDSAHQKRVKDFEDTFIKEYNRKCGKPSKRMSCSDIIKELSREEVKNTDLSVNTDKVKDNSNVREPITDIKEFTKVEKIETEPPKKFEEKTISIEPSAK
jgi:hypothetical protein